MILESIVHAIAFDTNGGPEVLRFVTMPEPVPGPGEVLIRVAYAGVNYAEAEHRRGVFGPAAALDVPGLEASGQVAAVGEGVQGFNIGESVTAYLPGFGGYAEYAVTPATFVLPLPAYVDLRTGGGFACVAPTAYGVVAAAARVQPGDTVLIHAAAGGVGTIAAQVARALGATTVLGTVGSADKIEYASQFGYDQVLLRDGFDKAVLELTDDRGVDVVLDPVGGDTRAQSLELLAPFGRLVAFGDAGGYADVTVGLRELWKLNRSAGGYNIGDVARRAPHLWRSHAQAVLGLVADGTIRLDITDTLPLADAVVAHQRLDAGTNRGKTVLAAPWS
jgi:NADPH2:quinone reductase